MNYFMPHAFVACHFIPKKRCSVIYFVLRKVLRDLRFLFLKSFVIFCIH
jgi:hypothetical protein